MNLRALFVVASLIVAISGLPLRESRFDMIDWGGRATGDVRFYLYTKANPSTPQELFIDDEDSVRQSNFIKSRQTKIIIHGWGGSYTTSPNPRLRDAYFSQGDFNIIAIDWYPYAKLNYISSRAKVPTVGEDCAELVDFLHRKFALNLDMLVVIGHSLGAHVAGFCGKLVASGKVAAIVGLDAAYPLYSYENADTRLSSDDAKYVQTIHTNGNVKGFLRPLGTASFYPNWGRSQPGCGVDLDGSCAHGRCVLYYAEAVRGYSYAPVTKCASYTNISEKRACEELQVNVNIGDPLEASQVEGIYYFETNAAAPFGHLVERGI